MVNHLSPVLGLQYCSFSVKEGEFMNLGSLPAEAPALLVATVEIVLLSLWAIQKQFHWTSVWPTCLLILVFPVVMYGCESWTVKKAERWRIDAFELWCWRRLLRVLWTARRSKQSILKEISPGCSLVGLMLKLTQNWTWNIRLVPNWERNTSRLYFVTLLI